MSTPEKPALRPDLDLETGNCEHGYGDTECPFGCHTFKLCRECHGWGTVTSTYPGGLMSTEDCRRCAGTGEEIR